jgi:hypothetical protein
LPSEDSASQRFIFLRDGKGGALQANQEISCLPRKGGGGEIAFLSVLRMVSQWAR